LEFEGGVIYGRAQQQNRRAGAEGDYALTRYTTATEEDIFDNWLDPIETDPREGERFYRDDDRRGIGDRFVTAALWGRPGKMGSPIN
jgi:hypothetical protein